ncbi:MAG: hypothetical protein BroJett009_24220 [Armatimonadota bacterium]|nr:MAG: hypothetical protein BroJett009_24220 [Armatimonadota bacterium]
MEGESKHSWTKWVGAAALLLLFGWFVWPTPYEYTRKAPNVWRVNRFTGIQEISTDKGWRTEEAIRAERKEEAAAEADKNRSEVESALKQLEPASDKGTDTRLIIYNPTKWNFDLADILVEYYKANKNWEQGSRIVSKLKAYTYDDIKSLEDAEIEVEGFTGEVLALPSKTHILQKATLRISSATKAGSSAVYFDPPLEFSVTRYFDVP